MDEKNVERAAELFGALLLGEEVGAREGKHTALYEAYHESSEVSDTLELFLKKLNLRLYEHNYCLYVTPGDHNRIFGYTNEDLKRLMGLRLNRELYLCYYIMFQIVSHFYSDSATYTYAEYVKAEEILQAVDASLHGVLSKTELLARNELEENSFKQLALLWDELPVLSGEESMGVRAGRSSKSSYVKLVFQFFIGQGLLLEAKERYYPTDRLHALIRRYFEEERGRLYEIQKELNKGGTDGASY